MPKLPTNTVRHYYRAAQREQRLAPLSTYSLARFSQRVARTIVVFQQGVYPRNTPRLRRMVSSNSTTQVDEVHHLHSDAIDAVECRFITEGTLLL